MYDMHFDQKREKLPGIYEEKYKSENLKKQIADRGMWELIPGVNYGINSAKGRNRIQKNDLLFSFIDEYFPDDEYGFEPNMRDGRYVFLPSNVSHQGIGAAVSNDYPEFLEISHFWYPCEYTEKNKSLGPGQVYIASFSMRPSKELADMIRRIYITEDTAHERYCTFPYSPDAIVTLKGDFLDDLNASVRTIRDTLKNEDAKVRHNGEGLISFMQQIMGYRDTTSMN